MAAPGPSNVVARRAVDELVEFSGETEVPKFMKLFILQQIDEGLRFINRQCDEAQTTRNILAKLNAMIVEMEAMEDQDEVYDTLMCLRDDRRGENSKLIVLNDLVVEVEEDIVVKETHLEIMDAAINFDKMKVVSIRARTKDESFVGLIRDLCFGLRMTLSKKHRLIAELEALGERGDAVRSLDHIREIVARDYGMLRDLEQLLAYAHVRMSLKDGYVADMEEKE
ncbi:hypothetical protein Tco_0678331 [Tanacetum coccineum]|uniref:Uncharacterized protein n=1 Tax=Tanacetum coccineum TaxID=301880 RepID=A0ABQ4XER3_9ASTR